MGERQASGGGEPGAERPDEDAEERPGRATGPAAAAPAGDAGGRAEAEPAGEPRTAEEGAEPPGAEKGRGLPTNFFVMGFTGALGVLTAWMLVEALVEVRGVFINILVALFLAVGLNPIIEFLRRRGCPAGRRSSRCAPPWSWASQGSSGPWSRR
ncbi:hypothetical protein ACFQXA_35605 [Nocardiopsis composta]